MAKPRYKQQSKRDRGRLHEGLPPKAEPKHGYCDDCGAPIHNVGAHAEACPGPPLRGRVFAGVYQCSRCLDTAARGSRCPCGGTRYPVYQTTKGTEPSGEDKGS